MGIKKKVLVFIDWYRPGFKAGGPIQSVANLVAHLSPFFDFYIVTRNTDYCETTPYSSVKSNEWNVLEDGSNVYYISNDRLERSTIIRLLKETDFDCLYLNGVFSFYFTLLPLFFAKRSGVKRIIVAGRGMLAQSALNVKRTKKNMFVKLSNMLKLFKNITFHATNDIEKEDILRIFKKSEVIVAGNLPSFYKLEMAPARSKKAGALRLVNIARIAPEKNLLYALEALKKVKGNVEFDFYGPVYDELYRTKCNEVMSSLPANVRANYKGSIASEKVSECLSEYHMLFMPTRGENFGHIILQSLSVGTPVIISDQTPWKDLRTKGAGWDINLKDISEFATVIDSCVQMVQSEYDQLSISSFNFAKAYNQNKEIIEANKKLFA